MTRHIFLDLDGCFADWEKLASQILGMTGEEFEALNGDGSFWPILEAHEDFFFNLDLIEDMVALYDAIKHMPHTFLSGIPAGGETWAAEQKKRWVEKHFPGASLITCRSRDKSLHMLNHGDVLVDDFLKWRHLWIARGGAFVHHTSADQTLADLLDLGFDVRLT